MSSPISGGRCVRLFIVAIVFCAVSFTTFDAQAQSEANANFAASIRSVQQGYEQTTRHLTVEHEGPKCPEGVMCANGGRDYYSASQIRHVLENTKAALLQVIPPDDEPLRRYVQEHFPDSANIDQNSNTVDRSTGDAVLTRGDYLIRKLAKLNPLYLDLTVRSVPTQAKITLQSAGGEHAETTTNSKLSNVWRGEYHYKVSKAGFKLVQSDIDLVREAGDTLECDLQSASSPEESLPCRLLQGH